jgi:hypothetical protein
LIAADARDGSQEKAIGQASHRGAAMVGSKPRYATTESIIIADKRSAKPIGRFASKQLNPSQSALKASASETYPVAVFLDIAEKLLGNWKTSPHV